MSELEVAVARLESEIELARRYAYRASQELHSAMAAELEQALVRARTAERRAAEAERRVDAAELRLSELRASATWRSGRAVVAVPAWILRVVRRYRR